MGRSLLALALFLSACSHTRVVQRDGCWVREHKNRWGDRREEIVACRPVTPRWSEEPLVRAIEDCLYQAQLHRYHSAGQKGDVGRESTKQVTRCLDQAQRVSLERIDRLQKEIAAGEAQLRRMHDENRELQKTIVACVEKSPNAIAEAHATTENKSDVASGTEVTPATYTTPGPKRRLRRATQVKVAPDPVCPPPQ